MIIWFHFLNSTKLLIILFVLSSVCGFYYSPIRELRSFASARLSRLLNSTQRRSSTPIVKNAIPCNSPCKGISVQRADVNPFQTNGCGPSSFPDFLNDLIPYRDKFKKCCEKHDIDYAMCNKPKEQSDRQFLKCIYNKIQRDRLSTLASSLRLIAAQGYYTAVDMFGCEAWIQSQMNACTCVHIRRPKKRPMSFEYNKYQFI